MSDKKQFSFDPHEELSSQVEGAYSNRLEASGAASDLDSILPQGAGSAAQNIPENYDITKYFETKLTSALRSTQALLNVAGSKAPRVPDIQSDEFSFVNFARLEHAYRHMDVVGWQPEVVIKSTGHAADFWTGIFSKLFKASSVDGSLFFEKHVNKNWDKITGEEAFNIEVVPGVEVAPIRAITYNASVEEILKAIEAATPKDLPTLGFNVNAAPAALHPSIEAYLTLQGIRKMTQLKFLDFNGNTWLRGLISVETPMHARNATIMHAPRGYVNNFSVLSRSGIFANLILESEPLTSLAGMRPTISG